MAKTNVAPAGYPHYGAGSVQVLVKEKDGVDYAVVFSPDPNNNELREAGLPMQFYYYPQAPRLAKHPDGRFKFAMQMFAGESSEGSTIGAEGLEEEAGAFLSMTSTIDIPETILKKALDQFLQDVRKKYGTASGGLLGLYNLGNRGLNMIDVRPIQLCENKISMHVIGEKGDNPFGGANPWSFNVQGEGEGQTFGLGQNAFSVLMGRNSAQLLEASLKKGGNDLVVENSIFYKAYMPSLIIKTTVKGKKVHDYFSAKVKADLLFTTVNWEDEYEKITKEGHIKSDIICDESLKTEEMEKLKQSLLQQQRENAFAALQKTIFEPADKNFTPAGEPKGHTFKFLGLFSWETPSVSLKSGKQIRELDYTDEVKYAGVYKLPSKISGNMDPLIAVGEKNPEQALSKYIQEVRLDEGFQKIHVVASLVGSLGKEDKDGNILRSPVKKVSIEVGYPDSKGNMVWKSDARKMNGKGNPYVTKESRDGKKTIDAIFDAEWDNNETANDKYVFDFVRNKDNVKPKIRRSIYYFDAENVCLENNVEEYELQGTKCNIEFPKVKELKYEITPEQLYACDTLEVSIKAPNIGTRKFLFNEENCEDAITFQAWYERNKDVTAKYKVKYTCKGKAGKTSKTVKIESKNWTDLDFEQGTLYISIPEGTEKENKAIEAIRAKFMEEEEEDE